MNSPMLDYSKTILKKVVFNKILFIKELRKCAQLLMECELKQLKMWCRTTFGNRFIALIIRNLQKLPSRRLRLIAY